MILKGEGIPVRGTCRDGVCYDLDLNLNGSVGMLHRLKKGWKIGGVDDDEFANAIGEIVTLWYE